MLLKTLVRLGPVVTALWALGPILGTEGRVVQTECGEWLPGCQGLDGALLDFTPGI